ncbi:MAG: FecR domain-containing protein [Rickettsiales bacterium]
MTLRTYIRSSAMVLALLIAAPAFAAESIGVVGALQGTANAAGASGPRTLKVGDQIFLDEEVTTGAGSKLQLMLNDRSTITLNPNSKVKVREFAFDASADSGSMAMESVKGAFRFIGGALSKQNPVTIKTPVSSIGIRGGIADTHIGPQGQTDAVFHYGAAMTMTNANGQTIEITQPGQGLSMQTPTDVPSFTPPAVLQQYIGAFGAAPDAAPSGEGAANTPAPSQDSVQGGDTTEGAPSRENAPSRESAPAPESGRSQERNANQQQFGTLGGANGATNAMNNPLRESIRERAGSDGINPNQLANQATTIATNANVAGANLLNTQGEFKGRYGMITPQPGTNIKERGSLVVIKQGDQFLLNATEFAPQSGSTHVGKIPVVTSAGHTALTNQIQLNPNESRFFTGFGFATSSLSSFYYNLHPVGGTDDINFFFGRQIPVTLTQAAMSNTASASSATNGITYFKFAPDLLTFNGVLSTPQLGFFDYEVLNIGAAAFTGVRDTSFGLAADFANKRFLTGFIDWSGATANRDIALAFGSVGSSGTDAALSGVIYDFSQSGSSLTSIATKTGSINSGAGTLYGNGNSQIEALMIEGTAPLGQTILTPAIRVGAGDVDSSIDENRTSGTNQMKGFAAGYIGVNTAGTPVIKNVWNTQSGGVTVTTNSAGSTTVASLALVDKTNSSKTVNAQFGTNNAQSAYLSNDLYAAQQSGVTYGGDFAGTGTNGNYGGSGFIANAEALSNVGNQCTSCEFVHWGVWAGNVNRTPTGGTALTDSTYVVPYVAGQVTDVANIPSVGTVNYTGAMYGSEFNSSTSTLERVEGDFTAGINLSTRQVTSFSGDVGSFSNMVMTGGPANISASGPANFNFSVVDTGMSATGAVNGALFGPTADNIGGNYSITGTGGINGTGVYLGDRP